MSRKDYNLVASEIQTQMKLCNDMPQRLIIEATLFMLATNLAHGFKADNAAFSRDKFMTACGF